MLLAIGLWSGSASAGAGSEQPPDDERAVVGDAVAIEPDVELRRGSTAPYEPLPEVAAVAVGDGVRTDDTGYAEVVYVDGSLTRLDVNTEFEVIELTDDAGVSSTRTSMELGRTWHLITTLGEGEFTVETSQATATVRGTAFSIACDAPTRCSYLVVSGVVELTLGDDSVVQLAGPSRVDVESGVAGTVTPVVPDEILDDSWLAANMARDVAAEFVGLAPALRGLAVATAAAGGPVLLPPTLPTLTVPATTLVAATTVPGITVTTPELSSPVTTSGIPTPTTAPAIPATTLPVTTLPATTLPTTSPVTRPPTTLPRVTVPTVPGGADDDDD